MQKNYYSSDELKEIIIKYGMNCDFLDSTIFSYGNALLKEFHKRGVKSEDPENDFKEKLICDFHACREEFTDLADFEAHYHLKHFHVCGVCKKTFQSNHLLELHVMETHDAYFAAQKVHRPMYSCYLEKCVEKFMNSKLRKDHCIEVHKFRPDFKFDCPDRKSQKKKKVNVSREMEDETFEMEIAEVSGSSRTNSKSSNHLKSHFQFGMSTHKTFQRSKKSSPLETMALDLEESLPQLDTEMDMN